MKKIGCLQCVVSPERLQLSDQGVLQRDKAHCTELLNTTRRTGSLAISLHQRNGACIRFCLLHGKVTIRTRDLLKAKFKFVDSYDSQLANGSSFPGPVCWGASGTSWPTPQCNTERGRPRQRPSNPLFWIAISQGTTHTGGVDFIKTCAFHEGWRRFHGLTPPGSLARLKKRPTITLRAVHGARNDPGGEEDPFCPA